MSETAVSKRTAEPRSSKEIFQPIAPFGRMFGANPFAMMREFVTELDHMFRGEGSIKELQDWAPAVDVQQCNADMVVSAELPGVKKEEVKVEVTDNTLTIHGQRKQEHKEDHEGYHRWERSYGHFYRAIPLPQGAKTDQVKAELKDGILRISIPVPEAAKKLRQVPVAG